MLLYKKFLLITFGMTLVRTTKIPTYKHTPGKREALTSTGLQYHINKWSRNSFYSYCLERQNTK